MANNKLLSPLKCCAFIALVGGATQCWAAAKFEEFFSVNLGTSFSSTLDLEPSDLQQTLDLSSGQTVSIGYGAQENNWRILLELNQTTADIQLENSDTAGKLTTKALFYNVYWVPAFDYNISALIGAGIGYADQSVKDINPVAEAETKISNAGWAAKLALGAEYRINQDFSVQLVYQNWFTDKIEDDKVDAWSVSDTNHSELSLGALYRF